MEILISGASGFIGGALVRTFLRKKASVRALVRDKRQVAILKKAGAEVFAADVLKDEIQKAFEGVDEVYNTIGVLGVWGVSKQEMQRVNVEATKVVLKASIKAGVKRFFHFSSAGVIGPTRGAASEKTRCRPSNDYERTKLEAERYVLKYSDRIGVTVFRPEFVYGPGDRHVLKLFKAIKRGRFFIIGDGRTRLHPTHIDDLMNAVMRARKTKKSIGETYLIVGPRPLEVREIANTIADGLRVKRPRYIPYWLVFATGVVFEGLARLGLKPLVTTGQVRFFTENREFSFKKARRDFGYKPKVDFEEGVKRTIRWYKKKNLL